MSFMNDSVSGSLKWSSSQLRNSEQAQTAGSMRMTNTQVSNQRVLFLRDQLNNEFSSSKASNLKLKSEPIGTSLNESFNDLILKTFPQKESSENLNKKIDDKKKIDPKEISDTKHIDTKEIDTKEIDTKEIDTKEISDTKHKDLKEILDTKHKDLKEILDKEKIEDINQKIDNLQKNNNKQDNKKIEQLKKTEPKTEEPKKTTTPTKKRVSLFTHGRSNSYEDKGSEPIIPPQSTSSEYISGSKSDLSKHVNQNSINQKIFTSSGANFEDDDFKVLQKKILKEKQIFEKRLEQEKKEKKKKDKQRQKKEKKQQKEEKKSNKVSSAMTEESLSKRGSFKRGFSSFLSGKQNSKLELLSPPLSTHTSPSKLISTQSRKDFSETNIVHQGYFHQLPRQIIKKIFEGWSNVQLLLPCFVCKSWQNILEQAPIWSLSNPNIFEIQNTPNIPFKEEFLPLEQLLNKEYTNQQILFQSIPDTSSYETERVTCLLRMIALLTKLHKPESFKSKLNVLEMLHSNYKNPIEAGLTTLLIAEKLSWAQKEDKKDLKVTSPQRPKKNKDFMVKESDANLKERIYYQAIDYFDQGKYWELGIGLLRELREVKQFNLKSYEEALDIEHNLLLKIRSEDRFFETYYYTEFFGDGFPPYYRKKKFIYRGAELERLGIFVGKTKERFPQAQILSKMPPPEEIPKLKQAILIMTCKTSSPEEANGKQRVFQGALPSQMKRFYKNTGVNVFAFSVPFVKDPTVTVQTETNTWIRTTYFWTKDTFPTINRCSPVESITESEINPLEHATINVAEKNEQLNELIDKVSISKTWSNSLPMTLSGIVDAAVNGGTQRYQDAFFSENFQEKATRKQRELCIQLREALFKQAEIVERGLECNERYHPENMKKMQDHLKKNFVEMKIVLNKLPTVDLTIGIKQGPSLLQLKKYLKKSESFSIELITNSENTEEISDLLENPSSVHNSSKPSVSSLDSSSLSLTEEESSKRESKDLSGSKKDINEDKKLGE